MASRRSLTNHGVPSSLTGQTADPEPHRYGIAMTLLSVPNDKSFRLLEAG